MAGGLYTVILSAENMTKVATFPEFEFEVETSYFYTKHKYESLEQKAIQFSENFRLRRVPVYCSVSNAVLPSAKEDGFIVI